MTGETVTVFGGSGFLGRAVIRALCKQGYRVVAPLRQPHLGHRVRALGDVGQVDVRQANLRYPDSVAAAMHGAYAVVNCVGLLYEKGRQTFHALHVRGAETVAEAAKKAGVQRLIHISSIGADERSRSAYARTKAEGEAAVRAAFPSATILRPSIVFGSEDGFFNRFGDMARSSAILPLIGGGKTRLQPIYVGDVADAVAGALARPASAGRTYELGGPRTYSFKELMQIIVRETDRPRILLSLPFFVMGPIGATLDALCRLTPLAPPLTGHQIEMLKTDNVVNASGEPGIGVLADLGVTELESVEAIVPTYLWRFRPYGQFQTKPAN
jgi:NADH dehydrogenase